MKVSLEYILTLPDRRSHSNVGRSRSPSYKGAHEIVPGLEKSLDGMKARQKRRIGAGARYPMVLTITNGNNLSTDKLPGREVRGYFAGIGQQAGEGPGSEKKVYLTSVIRSLGKDADVRV